MLYSIINKLDALWSFETVSAHCDIPCKIYDPMVAQINALTIIRLVDLIEPLTKLDTLDVNQMAQLNRLVAQKESHGLQLKEDIRVIWGDYFKQPQLTQFPEIRELTHSIMLQASKVKQHIDRDGSVELLNLVNRFATIFWQTKGVDTHTATCPYPPAEQVVYPKLS